MKTFWKNEWFCNNFNLFPSQQNKEMYKHIEQVVCKHRTKEHQCQEINHFHCESLYLNMDRHSNFLYIIKLVQQMWKEWKNLGDRLNYKPVKYSGCRGQICDHLTMHLLKCRKYYSSIVRIYALNSYENLILKWLTPTILKHKCLS